MKEWCAKTINCFPKKYDMKRTQSIQQCNKTSLWIENCKTYITMANPLIKIFEISSSFFKTNIFAFTVPTAEGVQIIEVFIQ